MIRFGLCCIFKTEPITFNRITAAYVSRLSESERARHISSILLRNSRSLLQALEFCHCHGIGCFRINSNILPIITHPEQGYSIEQLPGAEEIVKKFRECGEYARKNNIRTTFHPDQFILLSSPKKEVTQKSIKELEYHAMVAEWVNADVINIHGGGTYGDKKETLHRLDNQILKLPLSITSRLTLENDDRCYTPMDLLPVCQKTHIPLVYDTHHHRCLPDGLSVYEATELAVSTWSREPLFHISSPKDGWNSKNPKKHHDFIDVDDFPQIWKDMDITVEVEAKAKELAVLKLIEDLDRVF